MEMHQIRYFLAVTRTLNFTRAAEECHVAQPSLTRAVKLLEDELGGELFRRERNLSHLTDLGTRMLPLLQQCYDTALGAKSLATAIKKGEVATLTVALSRTVDMGLLVPFLTELMRAMNGVELKFFRGNAMEVGDSMKRGEADLAIAGPMAESWDRFDVRPLFTEGFELIVPERHRFAKMTSVAIDDLQQERLLVRSYCEMAEPLSARLRINSTLNVPGHSVASERDLIALLEGGMGIALLPRSTATPATLKRVAVDRLQISRTIYLYSVAGRPRQAPAATLMKQLQAADWSRYTT